ncbi:MULTISPECIES: glutaredoxin 3 [Nitrosomonas]|uniref:Glutaredoxin n=1 Tax=Nitrosomonas europaea (strain ATCC 19718 / CIP 103999 / KCTC 2705 / NBRC 14298) TaxID=228410 RepID=Q82SU3_NITEU|nr:MULTISPECIES: glutaredoxin 3 [Nitrosomonas]MDL1864522.1 glutaredoxin 3 [Betaproteobacteria bacterium PRO5]KXK40136.1 MAG: glutaredoxin [Nitrosomonas europaea]MBC6962043.1 glutaredoxin 3 [Nitrosomonas sp.]MBV6390365.1 Glutaredoxin 3 [Nitrosomonas europaea]MDF0677883.1 glutaredoxin 3 [Nitrosomonas sp.]
MPKIVMYVSGYCPYCTMAEKLLRARGVEEIEKIRVDLQPGLRAEMMQRTGRRTVPQIYIGPVHVGGYDDLAMLDRQGELSGLLAG